ncbi:PilW family protein [[Pseudomonas] boreopolis]
MVAIVIASFLVLGLVQVFTASRNAYQLSEGLARVQENARFAMDFLQRDIRMAGHFGCVNDQARRQSANVLTSHFTTGGVLDFGYSIHGYENATPTGLTLSPPRVAGTDSIVLRFLGSTGIPIKLVDLSDAAAPTIEVDPDKWSVLTENGEGSSTLFGIADCAFADVFSAQSTDASNGKVVVPSVVDLSRYGASPQGGPSMLFRAQALVYYVGVGASGQNALYRARINANGSVTSEELVEGIENLQFRYGMDRNEATDPTGYIATQGTAVDVGTTDLQWRRVGQVQVGFIVASPNPSTSLQARVLSVLGNDVTPPSDGRYRAVYENTIALRNRLYGN